MADQLHTVRIETDVAVLMRDGTVLRADVYRPDAPGRFPVILERTPYNRWERRGNHVVIPHYVAQRGYAVVIQDVRGRFGSDGDFQPFHQERDDGFDTVAWCAEQRWSSGKVGTYGGSYVGATQWLAATQQPPALVCLVPLVTSDDYYEGWTYQGGAFQLGFVGSWSLNALTLANLPSLAGNDSGASDGGHGRLIAAIDRLPESLADAAPSALPHLDETQTPYYFEWLRHPTDDAYWRSVRIADSHHVITTPALNVAGWFDIFLGGSLRNFVGMQQHGATQEARQGQRLIVGPWSHTTLAAAASGAQYFGMAASPVGMDLLAEHLRWWDHWLKGVDNGVAEEPPVRIFVMGDNEWRSEQEWPLARTQYIDYFFRSDGHANTLDGDGALSTDAPTDGLGNEPSDSFVYDPANPVPTNGGGLCCYPALMPGGPSDQTATERRADVLCYTTPPLADDIEVTGPLSVTLYAATDAPDTDFTAKLVDVCEQNNCAMGLVDGILRGRYRQGTARAVPLPMGEAVEYTIDLWATSNVFKRGHCIRVEISSSNFPRFDRNPNTGEEPGQAMTMRTARQTVFHTAAYPSRITLPVIPRPELCVSGREKGMPIP